MTRPRSEIIVEVMKDVKGTFTANDIRLMWPTKRYVPSNQEIAGLLKSYCRCETAGRNGKCTFYRKCEQ